MVLVEPGGRPASYTDPQITTLAKLPILIIFGVYLDTPTGIPNFSWQTSFDGCKAFGARVNTAGGQAQILHLPNQGIRGNSHMIMQDKNNLQIADTILKWIDEKAGNNE